MSRTVPTDHERAELQFPCSHCVAPRGKWCVVIKSGEWARWLHQPRWQQVREIVDLSGWGPWLIETDAELSALRQAVRRLLNDVRGGYMLRTDPDAIATRLEAALAARGQVA